jgi:hypothetical protein
MQAVSEVAPGSWSAVRDSLDPSWIEEALEASGVATIRRRRLPAEQVLWLVLGMAVFRERSIVEVAAKLDLALPGSRGVTAGPAGMSQARQLGFDKFRDVVAISSVTNMTEYSLLPISQQHAAAVFRTSFTRRQSHDSFAELPDLVPLQSKPCMELNTTQAPLNLPGS